MPIDQRPRRSNPRSATVLDLAALTLILTAVVAIVALSNATSAVLATAGATTALCYRAWRGRNTDNQNPPTDINASGSPQRLSESGPLIHRSSHDVQ
ncbi:hypothetical protein [Nocardia amamiensis]|uniref:hypothetical protein n=1 Tax=Nocardia amamiensis TaxID=404578 RepID=UPI0008319EA6|nr:hypothetical protein [Nocardia amamiensis]